MRVGVGGVGADVHPVNGYPGTDGQIAGQCPRAGDEHVAGMVFNVPQPGQVAVVSHPAAAAAAGRDDRRRATAAGDAPLALNDGAHRLRELRRRRPPQSAHVRHTERRPRPAADKPLGHFQNRPVATCRHIWHGARLVLNLHRLARQERHGAVAIDGVVLPRLRRHQRLHRRQQQLVARRGQRGHVLGVANGDVAVGLAHLMCAVGGIARVVLHVVRLI